MNTDNFVWNDELVKEYAAHLIVGKSCGITNADEHLRQFKQSKQPPISKEWEILSVKWNGEVYAYNKFDADDFRRQKEIWAVKRLSDNQIFKVGDRLKRMDKDDTIVSIKQHTHNDLWLCTEEKNNYGIVLSHAEKLPTPSPKEEDKTHSVLMNDDIYFHNNGRSYNEWFYEFRIKKEIEQGKWNALSKLIVDFINAPLGEIVTIEQYRAKKYTQQEVDELKNNILYLEQTLEANQDKVYTKGEVDAMMENVWKAARKINFFDGGNVMRSFTYTTLKHYQNSVSFPEIKNSLSPLSESKPSEEKKVLNWVVFEKDGFGFPTWESLKWDNDFGTNWDDTVKTFEHIESAEQYILENKPCLSLWDLVCMDLHITKEGMDFLRKKAKEKLCPKP